MPSLNIHHKYAMKYLRELGVNTSLTVVREINLLIDFPDEFFKYRDFDSTYTTLATCSEFLGTLYLYRYKYRFQFSQPIFKHDWGFNRCNRVPNTVEVLKNIVECLYGKYYKVLVDLHASLDFIDRCSRDYDDYLKWALRNNISQSIIAFITKNWDEILNDIVQD